ncbi:MAG: ATP-dependent endonuclease [Pyrinomonadaceae bacterium]
MEIEITLKNYRCFPDTRPARILIRNGFTSFVGVNNSGKSALLKFFYEFRGLFRTLAESPHELFEALQGNPRALNLSGISDTQSIFCNNNNRNIDLQFRISTPDWINGFVNPNQLTIKIDRGSSTWTAQLSARENRITGQSKITLSNAKNRFTLLADGADIDISKLRDAFRELSDTLYIGPFRNILNIGTAQYFDIVVGQQFVESWRTYKTGDLIEQNQSIYKLTEEIRRIFDFSGLEINASQKNDTLQVFINGKSFKLLDIGSGIAQFILVLASAAIKKPAFILIDEPELNLHPSLQLDFLTTLGSYAREGVMFATHSIGLARSSSENIYSVRKIADGDSEVAVFDAKSRLSEFAGELSFSGYQELGFDKILLVEGRTEVKTIQQFLRLWKKDHKVVLIPIGGRELINSLAEDELREIKRISPNVFALIDSERNSPGADLEPNREVFRQSCQRVGITCHVLERRATENYFSDEAVKKVKGDTHKALGEYEKLKDVSPSWSKKENWRIARVMSSSEIEATDLGQFLKNI